MQQLHDVCQVSRLVCQPLPVVGHATAVYFLAGMKLCVTVFAGSNGGSVPSLSNPPPSGSACNGYLPTNAYDRFLWVINFFASNGFYVVSLSWTAETSILQVNARVESFPCTDSSALPLTD